MLDALILKLSSCCSYLSLLILIIIAYEVICFTILLVATLRVIRFGAFKENFNGLLCVKEDTSSVFIFTLAALAFLLCCFSLFSKIGYFNFFIGGGCGYR